MSFESAVFSIEARPDSISAPSSIHKSGRYQSLDALRGIAAMVVVVQHSMMTLPAWSDVVLHGVHRSIFAVILGSPPLDVLWAGDAAVKVFFALSGFVLALMFLRPDPPSYMAFAVKRVCRIYIPYIVVVAIAMLIMTVAESSRKPELSEWFRSSWNHGVTWSLVLDHVLMLGQQKYNFVDNPIWSLVHEMRYSLVFPLVMWAVIRAKWWPLVASSLLASVAAMGALKHVNSNWAVDSLQYAFLFVTGATLAKYRVEVAQRFRNLPTTLRIAIGATSVVLLSAHGLAHAGIALVRAFAFVAPHIGAVLLLMSVIGSAWAQEALERQPCLWIGRVSYSLYLSHVVLLLTLVAVLHRRVSIYAILFALPALALGLAGVLHRWLEQPAIDLGRRLGNGIERTKRPLDHRDVPGAYSVQAS
ncbi:MAG TPA: acyltransferase [Bryobacteraceae bacterium]|nr:acyltransferase [Bryobacteraceae bacterium]